MKFLLLLAVSVGVESGITLAANKDDGIEHLMEKTHEGKRSPFRQIRSQLDAAAPAWNVVDRQLPLIEQMSRALAEAKNEDVRGAADGYVDAVKDLKAAAKKRDLAAARKAFQLLRNSCTDCQFKGGPGGKLEDEGGDD